MANLLNEFVPLQEISSMFERIGYKLQPLHLSLRKQVWLESTLHAPLHAESIGGTTIFFRAEPCLFVGVSSKLLYQCITLES
jgi:hypothetical protein